MRWLDQKVERFCWKHPRFGIPRLMLYVVIGTIVVWLFSMMDTTGRLIGLLSFDARLICRGQIWRLVTYVFIPNAGGVLGLAISLYFYYFIGSSLENAWGAGRFTIYYLTGMVLTALYALVFYWITAACGLTDAIGRGISIQRTSADFLNLSMFFAFATLWPDQMVLLFFFIPVKMKWLAWVDAALFAIEVVQPLYVGILSGHVLLELGVALIPVVAVANYLLFCGQWLFDYIRPSRVRQRTRQKARTIQFKQAAKKVQEQQKTQGYTRKCEVCGRTDRDYPDLEFRYCSRCAGFHCFCIDHINNHIHFTE